ncbi:glutamine synthetase family protein [uncultured Roseobacter sp.]|uniref:glutamine synthetase family protein n=1 Tax=uncultured Roseobacter sp. TaxID=114847 RepID=UPI00262EA1FF|nr:glutamine synthetase family protein [uncultured Roseobacter sp.]
MMPMPLIFAATCDLAGKVRGKAFPSDQLEKRLIRGVGWTPTNVQITCFDTIAESPFGALGDLLLIPDAAAEARVSFDEGVQQHFILGDITDLDGAPWDFCTRSLLKSALQRLERVAGVRLIAAFEHEFQLKGAASVPNQAYGREGFEVQRQLCEILMAALAEVGLSPDSIMKEYGPAQYEVVIGPEVGVRAADAAVIVRELTRSAARSLGEEATFTPIRDVASVGNGVHVHMSFEGADGQPMTYDPTGPCGMSELTSAFAAGVLKYLDRIIAMTAPSVISYERLTPHRWSAAYNNLGFRDREASLRVCPVTAKDPASIARQFNIEYRAADAACPHLALAAIVHAGVQGVEEGLSAPEPTEEDLSLLSPAVLAERGFVRLPETLSAALDVLCGDKTVARWFPKAFLPVYRAHKQAEIDYLSEDNIAAKCAAYEQTY